MWKVLKKVINRKGKCNLVDKITVNNTEITNKQEILDEIYECFALWKYQVYPRGSPPGQLRSGMIFLCEIPYPRGQIIV